MGYRTVSKGERISEYLLLEKIGEGAFGEVWKAEHVQIPGKFVAIKIPKNSDHVELIKKEAIFQHELDHANIVRTVGLNLESDPPYFVMEFFDGRNLRKLVQDEGILPPPYAIDVAVQVLEALQYAHAKGIVHKDIKPENILVDKKGLELKDGRRAIMYWVRITDLGLGVGPHPNPESITASDYFISTGFKALAGTMFYMAPEQMSGKGPVDRRADIYSVGVVLYEMLTGVLPLGMDLPSELNPVVPPEMDKIVKKALSVDRDQRYAQCDDMKKELIKVKEQFVARMKEYRDKLDLEEGITIRSEIPGQVKEKKEDTTTASRLASRPAPARKNPARMSPLLFFSRRIRRFELIAIGMAVVVTLVLSGVLMFAVWRKGPVEPKPVASPKFAALSLSTLPAAAEVSLDGVKLGMTPLRIDALPFRDHELRLERPFFSPRVLQLIARSEGVRKSFRVHDCDKGADLFTIDFSTEASIEKIVLERQKGTLRVETPGLEAVKVSIDGAPVGATPMELKDFDAGAYRIRLEKEGFKPVEIPVTLLGNSRVDMPVMMSELKPDRNPPPAPTVSEIDFETEPDTSSLWINGEKHAERTPCHVKLDPGEYQFRFEKAGYQSKEFQMIVTPGLCTKFLFRLTRISTQVSFRSDPAGARVFLDGELVGIAPVQKDNVESGSHQVKFQMDDHREQIQELRVDSTTPISVETKMVPKAASTVVVKCPLAGGNVYLGHRWLGQTAAGEARFAAPAGEHKLIVFGVASLVTVASEGDTVVTIGASDLKLVDVPEGLFWFGSRDKMPPANCFRAEKKACKQFWMDQYEVTVEQYKLFLEYVKSTNDHSRCHKGEPPNKDHAPDAKYVDDPKFNQPAYPVVGIDFYDAYAYAAWAGKALPTELEWEKAARGTDYIEFPWGSTWNPHALNYHDLGTSIPPEEKDSFDCLAPVGSFEAGRSPFGCYDMAGNAAEWCADSWDAGGQMRVVRGGSWIYDERDNYRVWWRESQRILYRGQKVGFRCLVRP